MPKIGQFGTQIKRASSQTIGKAAGVEEAETDRATKEEETDKVYQVAAVDPEGEIAQARLIWKAALMVNRFTEGEQEVRAIMVEVMAEEVGIETAGMVIIVKTDSNRITEIWKSTKNTQSRQTQKVLKSVFLQKFIKKIRRKICEKWNKKKYLVVNIKKYIKINISEIKITTIFFKITSESACRIRLPLSHVPVKD